MYLCESSTGWSFHCCGVQSVEAKSESASGIRLSATLWTVACQAFLPMGFSRQEYWSGLPFPPPGLLPDPGVEPRSPALAGRFFTVWATREARPLWSLSELHFGLSGVCFWVPGDSPVSLLTSIPIALVEVKVNKCCLPIYFFFYDINLTACLYHRHYCYFVNFCYHGYCLAGEVNFWPLGCWKPYPYQSLAGPVFPTYPLQTMVHDPSGTGSLLSTSSNYIMVTNSQLALLRLHKYLYSSSAESQVSKHFVGTELAPPVFREQSYILSKCLLYCENAGIF